MKIYIACDHRGIEIKNKLIHYLKDNGLDIQDIGIPNSDFDNYPEFAFKLGELVRENENNLGILICGTGIGMSIAANKVKGIRCVRAVSVDDAFTGKNHNSCNVLAIGSEVTSDINLIIEIVDTFINTKKADEKRHRDRVKIIEEYEDNN